MITYQFAELSYNEHATIYQLKNYTTGQTHITKGECSIQEMVGRLSKEGWRIVFVYAYPSGSPSAYQLQRETPQAIYEENPPPTVRSYALDIDDRRMWVDDAVIPFESLPFKAK